MKYLTVLLLVFLMFCAVVYATVPNPQSEPVAVEELPQHGTSISDITVTVRDANGTIKSITHIPDGV